MESIGEIVAVQILGFGRCQCRSPDKDRTEEKAISRRFLVIVRVKPVDRLLDINGVRKVDVRDRLFGTGHRSGNGLAHLLHRRSGGRFLRLALGDGPCAFNVRQDNHATGATAFDRRKIDAQFVGTDTRGRRNGECAGRWGRRWRYGW